MDPLNPVEARVLGSLMEKDMTTPDYYPLTLNALTNACNQSSNRDPVVAFAERDVVRGLDGLREKKLAYMLQGADNRVPKYGHRIAETLEIGRPETAVLCVLLLRGPQTVGEIRGRTERMHAFPALADAEACLDGLAARQPEALVVKLRRQPGMKEQRYAHLLSGAVEAPVPEVTLKPEPAALSVRLEDERIAKLEASVAALSGEVADLRQELAAFKKQLE
jgi:uncharacterized protein YceH (UPF0502 family)